MKAVWKLLTSVKLSVVLGGLIAIACIVGATMEQESANRNVYHTVWFIGLLGAMALNLTACCIQRARFLKASTFGSFVSHVGALLILIGGAIGLMFGSIGFSSGGLKDGAVVDHYFEPYNDEPVSLPFTLNLDKFSLDLYPPQLWTWGVGQQSVNEKYMLEDGMEVSSITGAKVRVEQIFERYLLKRTANIRSQEPNAPVIRAELLNVHDESVFSGWFTDEEGANVVMAQSDGSPPARFTYLGVVDSAPAEPEDPYAEFRLFVSIGKDEISRSLPLNIGTTQRVSEGYSVTVADMALDFTHRTKPLEEQQPINPAIQVDIVGPMGAESRWVFSLYPQYSTTHAKGDPNISLSFVTPHQQGIDLARIYNLRTMDGYSTWLDPGPGGEDVELVPDELVRIAGSEFKVRLFEYHPDAEITEEHVDLPDGDMNYAIAAVASDLRNSEEDVRFVVQSGSWKEFPEEGFTVALGYEKNFIGDIRNYESVVTVKENDVDVLTQTIATNAPLVYNGYRIYQNAYRTSLDGSWVGAFRIVRDPGIPIVFLGFAILGFGLMYASFVRPILRKKSKGGQA